jgi:ribosome-binding protein aMBF1 (putative translation factor)
MKVGSTYSFEEIQKIFKVFPNGCFHGHEFMYEDYKTTGKRIMQLRKERRLTVKEVANEIGWNYECVQDWEKGELLPSKDTLDRIANFFGVSVTYFQKVNYKEFEQLTIFDI